MDAEQRAAILLLAIGLPAFAAVLWAAERPLLRPPSLAAVVFLAAAAFALVVGWAMRW